ncbi:MAG: hypothetical protein IT448_00345 [Phycisphaerales bacterium]|nr:hypothetical protein [Phycisphaerales bacterium]
MSDGVYGQLTTPEGLHRWIGQHLELQISRRAVCPGHSAPFEYLVRSYFEPSQDMVVWAPRGGGKTRLAAIATLLDLIHKPGLKVCILGGSLDQSKHVWWHLLDDLQRLGVELNQGRSRRLQLENGSLATILAQSQTSVRGQRVQKLRCDEVDLFDPDVLEAAQLVTRSLTIAPVSTQERPGLIAPLGKQAEHQQVVRGAVELISTFHHQHGPMAQQVELARASGRPIVHWCLMEVLERCPAERSCEGCPLWEECRGVAKHSCDGHLKIDDAISLKQRVSVDTWQSELLCRRPRVRGRVFDAFDRSVHVKETCGDETAADAQMSLGMDFGYANPFVCLWVRKIGAMVHVMDEYVQRQKTLDAHLDEIQQRSGWGKITQVHCDPAGGARNEQTARSSIDLLRRRGYRVLYRRSQIVEGLELVRSALQPAWGQPRLAIHPRCQHLIEAMENYRYPDGGGELPLKDGVYDHPMDALRYWFINARRGGLVEVLRY